MLMSKQTQEPLILYRLEESRASCRGGESQPVTLPFRAIRRCSREVISAHGKVSGPSRRFVFVHIEVYEGLMQLRDLIASSRRDVGSSR
jgi:hypothetical protein